jgi:hypothetical protein
MSLRPLEDGEFRGPHGYTRVYYDSDWQEYRVKLWQGPKRVREKNSDYHTDDRLDALETAQRMVEEPRYAS